jgi:Transglycosylase-like domain
MALVATVLAMLTPTAGERGDRWAVVRPYNAKLERMAMCESTKRWHIFNPPYSGGLQFTIPTWRSVGGRGMPHWHSPLEQKYRAVLLIRRRGYAPWPVCGRA